jgi:hypothetical protein
MPFRLATDEAGSFVPVAGHCSDRRPRMERLASLYRQDADQPVIKSPSSSQLRPLKRMGCICFTGR